MTVVDVTRPVLAAVSPESVRKSWSSPSPPVIDRVDRIVSSELPSEPTRTVSLPAPVVIVLLATVLVTVSASWPEPSASELLEGQVLDALAVEADEQRRGERAGVVGGVGAVVGAQRVAPVAALD